MLNKRLLIKNLLGHSDENSFYDRKRRINWTTKEGKGKFLKHICALANSNPENNAYLVVGVEDEPQEIVGVDFFDDSKIQSLVNAYLENPPWITYENISFPDLPQDKVVGLVTIRSVGKICALRKNIGKYYGGMVFFREGSISLPKNFDIALENRNSKIVEEIERQAQNNIKLILDGVMDFIHCRHQEMESHYRVYREQFVLCWAGIPKKTEKKTYYSRVDIELINEQVRLFYSALDEVEINEDEYSFSIVEYVKLGLKGEEKYEPLEKLQIDFHDNGSYKIHQELIFNPPKYNERLLSDIRESYHSILEKMKGKEPLHNKEIELLRELPSIYLMSYLNGYEQAKEDLEDYRFIIKKYDSEAYSALKEALRVLRKVKYNRT